MALAFNGNSGGGGGGGVQSVTAGDTSIVVAGTAVNPTVETADLATIATDHATSGDVSLNSHKATNLAAPTAGGDAATKTYADTKVASVAATDTSIVVAGTATAPTIATGTLDVIAADHPPAADWSNNSHKITSLANGASAQDAAAFGQIPLTAGLSSLVYRYTVTGADKASIDTGTDTPDAGSNDWTNGDLLEMFLYVRTDEAVQNSDIGIKLNNDGSSIYYRTRIRGNNNTVAEAFQSAAANLTVGTVGANATASVFGAIRLTCPNYRGTVGFKSGELTTTLTDHTTGNSYLDSQGWQYESATAISRLAVAPITAAKKLKIGTQLLIYKRLAS